MLQACAQAVDFKVGHHFGEGQRSAALGERRIAFGTKKGKAVFVDILVDAVAVQTTPRRQLLLIT
jgi:hypothetical protein